MKKLLGLMFLAGAIGVVFPTTKNLFLNLTPIFLGITGALMVFTYPNKSLNNLSLIILIPIATWLIEVNGVSTGKIFGIYQYGPTLGYKIFNVPITIGINWLILLLGAGAVVEEFIPNQGDLTKAATGAAFMTVLDIFIEPVAISLNYWTWENDKIPNQNFIAWWIISFLILFFMKKNQLIIQSSLYRYIFVLEFIFFLTINLLNTIFF